MPPVVLPRSGPDGWMTSASRDTPELSFEHLLRLTDDTGLLEHARGPVPRRDHGYCVDDVSRGLVVLSREPDLGSPLVDLVDCYLAFVSHALDEVGRCRNRLGYDRRWADTAGLDDSWGRAVWGLGSLAAGQGPQWRRAEALDRFDLSATRRSPWGRATAFAVLGAAAVLDAYPRHSVAHRFLVDALPTLGRLVADSEWPWPEPRLTYANAVVAEALIAVGQALGDDRTLSDGLALLAWLFEVQVADGHLSPVPSRGWTAGEPRPGFDQQPIEAGALAEAAARAWTVTGDDGWRAAVQGCVGWFAGHNDSSTALYNSDTGGGHDGLEVGGRNANQGAESTLAAVATLQVARRLDIRRC